MKQSRNNKFSSVLMTLFLGLLVSCGSDDLPESSQEGQLGVETQKVVPIYTNSTTQFTIEYDEPALVFDVEEPNMIYSLRAGVIGDLSQYDLALEDVKIEMLRGPRDVRFDPSSNEFAQIFTGEKRPNFYSDTVRFRLFANHENFILESIVEVPVYFRGNGGELIPLIKERQFGVPTNQTVEMDAVFGASEQTVTFYAWSFELDADGDFVVPEMFVRQVLPNGTKRLFGGYRLEEAPEMIRSNANEAVFRFDVIVEEIHFFEQTPVLENVELEITVLGSEKQESNTILLTGPVTNVNAPKVYLPDSQPSQPLAYSESLFLIYPVQWEGEVASNEWENQVTACSTFLNVQDASALPGFSHSCENQGTHGICTLTIERPSVVDSSVIYCLQSKSTLLPSNGSSVTGSNTLYFRWEES